MALKKTGKVWVSTQEKDRFRCEDTDLQREKERQTVIRRYELVFKQKNKIQSQSLERQLLNV